MSGRCTTIQKFDIVKKQPEIECYLFDGSIDCADTLNTLFGNAVWPVFKDRQYTHTLCVFTPEGVVCVSSDSYIINHNGNLHVCTKDELYDHYDVLNQTEVRINCLEDYQ